MVLTNTLQPSNIREKMTLDKSKKVSCLTGKTPGAFFLFATKTDKVYGSETE